MKILLLMIITVSLWANIGNIMAMKGVADVKRANSLLSASNGMVLLEGDELITKTKTRVQVMLKDNTVITIGSNSTFSFLEFVFDTTKRSKISMKASRGFFRSVTGKISKVAPERFKIVTLTATIGIRGTDFSGDISPQKEIFKCYEGEISVEFDGNSNDIEAGMMMQINQNKVEVKEISVEKVSKKLNKQHIESIKKVIIKAIDEINVSPELVKEIVQVVREKVYEEYKIDLDRETVDDIIENLDKDKIDDIIEDITPIVTKEPFTIIPNSYEREKQY